MKNYFRLFLTWACVWSFAAGMGHAQVAQLDWLKCPRHVVDRVMAAHGKNDLAAVRAALDQDGVDPFLCVDELFARHLLESAEEALFAAQWLAEGLDADSELTDFVEARFEDEDLDAERSLRKRLQEMEVLAWADDLPALRQALAEEEDEEWIRESGLCAVRLASLRLAARLYYEYRDNRGRGLEDAKELSDGLLVQLDDIGWWAEWARVQFKIYSVDQALGNYTAVLERIEQVLEIELDPHFEAKVLDDKGLCLRRLGELEEAVACHREALARFYEYEDDRGVAASYCHLAQALLRLHDLEEALECNRRAMVQMCAQNRRYDSLIVAVVHAKVLLALGDAENARRWVERVIEHAGNEPVLSQVFRARGQIEHEIGDLPQALDWYRKARDAEPANRLRRAQIELGMGKVLFELGEWSEAESILHTCRESLELHREFDSLGQVWTQLAMMAAELEAFEAAIRYIDKATDVYRRVGEKRRLAWIRVARGRIYEFKGDLSAARDSYAQAHALYEEEGAHEEAHSVRVDLAYVATLDGRFEIAAEHLASCSSEPDRYSERTRLGRVRARLFMARGEWDEALKELERCLEHVDRHELGPERSGVLEDLAILASRRGRPLEAVEWVERSIEADEALGTRLGPSARLGLSSRLNEASSIGTRALVSLYRESGDASLLHRLFRLMEYSRARVMETELARQGSRVASTRSRFLLWKLGRERGEYRRWVREGRPEEHLANKKAEIRNLRAHWRRAEAEERRKILPGPIELRDFRRRLSSNTAFVHLASLGDEVIALSVERAGAVLRSMGESATLEEAFIHMLRSPKGELPDLTNLRERILTLFGSEWADVDELVLSADTSFLATFPFAALFDGSTPARAIRYAPSATIYASLLDEDRSREMRPSLIFGPASDYGDLAPLHHGFDEARAVASVLKDSPLEILQREQATKSRILEWLEANPVCDVVHIVTHGDHARGRARARQRSHRLVLQGEGVLAPQDLKGLELDANLVVLSACRTGLGERVPGEGVLGLVRAFIVAGAREVLVTNWDVDDEATASLMKDFHERRKHLGDDSARALSEAQRRARQAGRAAMDWSGIVLWGASSSRGE